MRIAAAISAGLSSAPWLYDLLLAACGVLVAWGWFPSVLEDAVSPALGLLLFGLYVAEHLAFVHRARRSLLKCSEALGARDGAAALAAVLPELSYTLIVGPVLRAAFRLVLLMRALHAFGVPDPEPESALVFVLAIVLLGELVFAVFWMARTTQLSSKPTSVPPGHLRRDLELARRRSTPARDLAADLVAALWSLLLFGALAQAFADDLSRWPEGATSADLWVVAAGMLVVTFLLMVVIHVPLHLDTWMERRLYARSARQRWALRASASLAMATALLPGYLALVRAVFS